MKVLWCDKIPSLCCSFRCSCHHFQYQCVAFFVVRSFNGVFIAIRADSRGEEGKERECRASHWGFHSPPEKVFFSLSLVQECGGHHWASREGNPLPLWHNCCHVETLWGGFTKQPLVCMVFHHKNMSYSLTTHNLFYWGIKLTEIAPGCI